MTTRHCIALGAAVLLFSGCGGGGSCDTDAGTVCATGGTGTIDVTMTGLPAGLEGSATLSGASTQTVTHSQTLSMMGSGAWGVSADRVADHDPIVRTAYQPAVDPASFCLPNGGNQPVHVTYSPIATSNKLWATNGNGGSNLLGYGSPSLRATGAPAADVKVQGHAGGDLTFDREGNLWTMGATVDQAALNRFPAAQLGSSGMKTPDRELNLAGAGCTPVVKGLAFDPAGNLWVTSPCRHSVYKLDAASLNASGTLTPSVTLPVMDPVGLAFDSAGDLWVGDQATQRLLRFDASSLSGSSATPAATVGGLATDNPMDTSVLSPNWLAFDSRGNLWSNDFGGNIFFRIKAADLSTTGDVKVKPGVRITVGVTALLEGFAFDEAGGLWSSGSMGKLIRLGPEQLDTETNAGAPTVPSTILTSADIGQVSNVAFYPAPAGLPLYHRVR